MTKTAKKKQTGRKSAPAQVSQERVTLALRRAKLPTSQQLNTEQATRASNAPAGLVGKALATFILDGKSISEQDAEAREERANGKREEARERAAARPKPTGRHDGMSITEAIEEVLRRARGPLDAGTVTERILKDKLAPGLKGKTPKATVAARLSVFAKKGERFERTGPGKYTLLGKGGS